MTTVKESLLAKFKERRARVAVIGLGYVGLPLAVALAEAGYEVIGIDVDGQKVTAVNRGESYIADVPSERLRPLVARPEAEAQRQKEPTVAGPPLPEERGSRPVIHSPDLATQSLGHLTATTDYAVLARCDAVSICLPTPLNKTGDPDISYIVAAGEQIARHLHAGMAVILESTTYPGTTSEVLLPILMGQGDRETGQRGEGQSPNGPIPPSPGHRVTLSPGQDFFLAFSPERVDPGRTDWTIRTTPKVVGGVTPHCLEVVTAYYGQVFETLAPVSSPETAEMVKLFENTFRSVNIALANELLVMCDKLGLDAWEVLEAADTKPFGFLKFTPGPGLGGHCIPVDPHYLSWKLRTVKYNARFIQMASEINTAMPGYWVQKVQDALNQAGRAVNGSRVLVLGVAYKRDIDDIRESPAIDIIHLLLRKGAHVVYHDPCVPQLDAEGLTMESVPDLDGALATADCVVIATDHSGYDWAAIRARARLVVDTRHVLPANS